MNSSDCDGGYLLCLDKLQRGDVILSHGGEVMSKAIAAFGGGEFSHAALVIGGNLIYESDGALPIGFKQLKPAGWSTVNGSQVLLGELPEPPVRCCVLRHPEMEAISEAKFREAFDKLLGDTHGRDYAAYAALPPMARRLPRPFRTAASKVAGWVDKRLAKKGKILPGAFCSEVVAKLYINLGLRIDLSNPSANQTAPFDFSSPGSAFDVKLSFVIPRAALPGPLEPWVDPMPIVGGKQWNNHIDDLFAFINNAARTVQYGKAVHDAFSNATTALHEQNQKHLASFQQDIADKLKRVEELYYQAVSYGNTGDQRRTAKLLRLYGEDGCPFVLADLPAGGASLTTFLDTYKRLVNSRRRTECLFVCTVTRNASKLAEGLFAFWSRWRFRRLRRNALFEVRSNLSLQRTLKAISDRREQTTTR
jgi:hypothetical protein